VPTVQPPLSCLIFSDMKRVSDMSIPSSVGVHGSSSSCSMDEVGQAHRRSQCPAVGCWGPGTRALYTLKIVVCRSSTAVAESGR